MQGSLFNDSTPYQLSLPDADVSYYPAFFTATESGQFFDTLQRETDWQQERLRLFNVDRIVPRLTAWYGDTGTIYGYSNLVRNALPWTPALLAMKARVEAATGQPFNSVLLNLYRDGRDSVAWHADDEPELRAVPVIASVSLGAARTFQLRHRYNKSLKTKIELAHGSLLLMKGSTQLYWQHQVPKTKRPAGARINLTFRVVQPAR